jgi:hypothetical protein
LQALLKGDFSDFQIVILLHDDWQSEPWGHLKLSANEVAVQKNVAQAFAISA